ncbi:sodium channel modifier 1-like [Pelodytes ibericus]
MSFKREGDDASQLNVLKLQKRRVADLLASYIPEDEALLLKNGSYACTVCYHRPVFNTIDMLSVHRNGKKHLASQQQFYGKKEDFQLQLQKRQHQEFVRAEESGEQPVAPLLMQTRKITQNALLKATPYNSCCSRNRSAAASRTAIQVDPAPCSSTLFDQPEMSHQEPVIEGASSSPHVGSEPPQYERDLSKQKTKQLKKGHVRRKTATKCPEKQPGSSADPEKTRAMQHYLLLKSSGWVPDGAGNWVKDETVEFDSDEEEPPALPPS